MNDDSENKMVGNGMGKSSNKHIRVDEEHCKRIEIATGDHGITLTEFARNAALAATECESVTFPPEIAAQIERIYRGVYLLTTLRREEMVRKGRREELDQITKAAHE